MVHGSGTVNLNDVNTNGLTIDSIDTTNAGAVPAGSNITVTSANALTLADAVTAGTGLVTMTATSITAKSIVLEDAFDAGSHTVNLTATNNAITTGNNAINFDNGTITAGDLNLTTASGGINENFGQINSAGTMTIAASDGSHDRGNSVNFSANPSNFFGTVNITDAGDINLHGMDGYILSGISSTGNIYAETNYGIDGSVLTTGTLEVSGAIQTSKTGGTIDLSNTRTSAKYGIKVDSLGSLSASGGITVATTQSELGLNHNGIDILGNINSTHGDVYIYDNRNYGLDGVGSLYAADMTIVGSVSTTSGSVHLEDFGAGTIDIASGATLDGGNTTGLIIQSDNGSLLQSGGTMQSEIASGTAISLTAANNISQDAGATISASNATTADTGISITASGGNIIQDGSVTTAGSQIEMIAHGDFTQHSTGIITAGSLFNWGNVTVSAYGESVGSTGIFTQAGTIEGNDLSLTASATSGSTGDLLQNGSLISHDSFSSNNGVQLYQGHGLNLTQGVTGTISTTGSNVYFSNNTTGASEENITQAGSINTHGGDAEFTLSDTGTITQNSTGSITANQVALFLYNNATVDLNGAANTFSAVSVVNGNGTTTPISTALNVTDQGALAFGLFYNNGAPEPSPSDTLSSLLINAGGNVTQLTSNDDGDTSESLTVTGATTINAGSHNITLDGANHFNGVVNLSGNTVRVDNIPALEFGNVTATGDLSSTVFGAVTQATGTSINVTGATNINAESNDITLTNNNVLNGAVSLTGNAISLTQAAGNDLTLNAIDAYGNVTVKDSDGTLTFTGSTPTITLRDGASNNKVILVASHLSNQNSGANAAIDLGTGSAMSGSFI